ncbi:MAG: hypothetical protein ACLRQF_18705 [Thomasclavelia ramosa]
MSYELVISVLKGGAFMRYRVGDMYQCIDVKIKMRILNYRDLNISIGFKCH